MSKATVQDEIKFYVSDNLHLSEEFAIPENFTVETWRPARDGFPKFGSSIWPSIIWWAFHKIGVFSNPNCGILMIKERNEVVHRSLVTPKWYRFPEMQDKDLQIGDTWTREDFRGQGLAKIAISAIHREWSGQYAKMWYLTDTNNIPSVKVIEKAGYALAGIGERTKSLKGQFIITDRS